MNLLIKNLVTATTIPEKPSITGIVYTGLTILIGLAIIVTLIAVLPKHSELQRAKYSV